MTALFYGMVFPLEKNLPKLLEKAHESNKRCLVLVDTQEHLLVLNTVLWTYATMAFIPHGYKEIHGEWAADQPIWLTCTFENPNNSTLLVNTCGMTYKNIDISGFEKIMDLYDMNDSLQVTLARERAQELKGRNFPVIEWAQTHKGAWEKGGLIS